MNLKIKFRESFRPFAPVVLRERAGEFFDLRRGRGKPVHAAGGPGGGRASGFASTARRAAGWTSCKLARARCRP